MDKALKLLATAAGAIAGFYTGMPMAVKLLILLMVLDYASGIATAIVGRSRKIASGALSSKTGFTGIARKAMILTIVLLASVLDSTIDSAACTGAVTMFYIVNESLSILENAVLLGVPVPKRLTALLDIAKQNQDSQSTPPAA